MDNYDIRLRNYLLSYIQKSIKDDAISSKSENKSEGLKLLIEYAIIEAKKEINRIQIDKIVTEKEEEIKVLEILKTSAKNYIKGVLEQFKAGGKFSNAYENIKAYSSVFLEGIQNTI